MSHRPLATVLAWAVDGDPARTPSYLNTVYASFVLPADDPGLQAWIDEE